MRKINPGLVYASITAYGQYGPYAERPGFDCVIQALSGHMFITGFKDCPPTKAGSAFTDYGSGLYCVIGILLAIRHRDQTGQGQEIDISMLDAGVSFMETVFAQYRVLNEVQPQMGNARPFTAPTNVWKCKDGYVCFAITFNKMWERFTKLIGREDLTNNPRFASSELRRRNREYLDSLAQGWLANKTRDEAVKLLVEAGIPAGQVNTIREAIEDPQIRARDMIVELEHPGAGRVPVSGIVIKLSISQGSIETPAPIIGQHNEEIYCGLLGYDKGKLSQLKEAGII